MEVNTENIDDMLSKDMSWDIVCEMWKRGDFSYFIPEGGFENQEKAFEILMKKEPVELLYGGAGGGGKSFVGWIFCMMEAATKPNLEILIGRKEITNLADNLETTVSEVSEKFNIPEGLFKYNATKHFYYFPKTKARIRLSATVSKPSDTKKDAYGSAILSYVWLEEGQETPFLAYDVLAHTRLGRQNNLNEKYGYHLSKLLITANPDKGWLYSKFYQPHKDNELRDGKYFIPALAKDNPFGADYIKYNLQNIEDPVLKARLMDGNWEYEENQFQLFKHSEVIPLLTNPLDEIMGNTFISIDPAGQGKDLAIIWVWKGYTAIELHIAAKSTVPEIIARVEMLEQKHQSQRQNTITDYDGLGNGVGDFLFGCTKFRNKSSALEQEDEDYDNIVNSKKQQIFPDLKTQTYYKFSEIVKETKVNISRGLTIEFFGTIYPTTREKYTDLKIREMVREELESIVQLSKPEDKKYKISTKKDIKLKIGRSNDLTDGLMFRFIKEVGESLNAEKEHTAAVVKKTLTIEETMFEEIISGY